MSERGFTSGMETALDSSEFIGALALYLDWPGGAVRFWSGVGELTWDGHTWIGGGEFVSLDKIVESSEKADIGVELTLNYLDDDIRNEVNANDPVGRDASIYLLEINPANRTVTESYELFPGFIDQVDMEDGGGVSTGRVIVRLASELARGRHSTYYTLSDAHQQLLFSGDKGMEFAPHMDRPIMWGRKPVPVYVPGTPSVPPANEPYPGYNDQFTFPLPGQ